MEELFSLAVFVLSCFIGVVSGFLFFPLLGPLGAWWLGGYVWIAWLIVGIVTGIIAHFLFFESVEGLSLRARALVTQLFAIPIVVLISTAVIFLVGGLLFTLIFWYVTPGHPNPTAWDLFLISAWTIIFSILGMVASFIAGLLLAFGALMLFRLIAHILRVLPAD